MITEELEHNFEKRAPFDIFEITLRERENQKDFYHWHSFLEITCIESGSGIYYVRENLYPVQKGDIVIFNNLEPHCWEVREEMKVLVAVFSIDFVADRMGSFDCAYLEPFIERGSNFKNWICHNHEIANEMGTLLHEIYSEWQNRETGYKLMAKASVLKILTLFIRYFQDESKSSEPLADKKYAMKRLECAFLHMYNNYQDKITLDEMADACHMSPTYFSSYFHQNTGCTFSNYLSGIRIRHAQGKLKTSTKSITEIALECGFNNMSNFYRLYKKHTGLNPGDER